MMTMVMTMVMLSILQCCFWRRTSLFAPNCMNDMLISYVFVHVCSITQGAFQDLPSKQPSWETIETETIDQHRPSNTQYNTTNQQLGNIHLQIVPRSPRVINSVGFIMVYKLVGGLEHFFKMTFHILGTITPTDELIFFRGVGWNHQAAIIIQWLTTISHY